MSVSAKTEYACLALLELASTYSSEKPVQVRKIAETHGIPARFLVQILLQLKSAGFVTSTRGAAGGYRLACDPGEITVWDVMCVFDWSDTSLAPEATERTATSRALHDVWLSAAQAHRDVLSGITFAELAEQARAQTEDMYYI